MTHTAEPMTLERAAADIDDCMLGGLAGPARMRRWKESINAELARQREAEPLVVEAVATVVKDDDGDLRLDWLLEGGICGLEDGCVLLVSDGLNEAVEEDGYTEVYTHPQRRNAAEVTDEAMICAAGLRGTAKHIRLIDAYAKLRGDADLMDRSAAALESAVASRDREDAERFDFIERECLDLRCVEYDDDFYFVVVEHHMGEPRERVIGTGAFPRQAIDAARRENKP
jgi:hypothetical protein